MKTRPSSVVVVVFAFASASLATSPAAARGRGRITQRVTAAWQQFKHRGQHRLAQVEQLYMSGDKTRALANAEGLLQRGPKLGRVTIDDRSHARLYAGVIHSDMSMEVWARAKQRRAAGDSKGFRALAKEAIGHRTKARRHFARLLDHEPSYQPAPDTPAHVMRDMRAAYRNPSRFLTPSKRVGRSRLAQLASGLVSGAKARLGRAGSRIAAAYHHVTGNTAKNAARVAKSVVQIDTGAGSGSGFVYRSRTERGKRFIMTNQHVVAGLQEGDVVSVGFASGAQPILARIRGSSYFADVAVLEPLQPLPRGVKALKLRRKAMHQGDPVAVVGHPYGGQGDGVQPSVSVGVVSQARRGDDLVTDANSAQGNSGGPVVDRRGRVVGMLSAGVDNWTAQAHGSDYGLVRTTSVINQVLKRAERGTITHASTGIYASSMSVSEGQYLGSSTNRPVIRDLKVGSPAHRAGLRVGDVIVGYRAASSGHKLLRDPSPGALFKAQLALRPNERVTFEVLRDGERHRFRTTATDMGQLWNQPWAVADGGVKQLELFQ